MLPAAHVNTPTSDAQIREIVRAAERAHAAGQRDDARRLLSQAQSVAPDHPLVLNAAGVQALHRGDPAAARQLLEQAIQRDAANPSFWLNLASTFRRLALPEEETRALERVLALEPRHLLALLQKGTLLELQGRRKSAARIYQSALQTLPHKASLPESLKPAVTRALDVVRENDAVLTTFLEGQLHEVRAQHSAARQGRFDHALDAFLGKRRIYTSQPTFLHFPKLPAWEFYPREDFPWMDEIESGTAEIRAELEHVFAADADRLEPYIAYPDGVPLDQWAELNHSRRWSVFYLWRDGEPVPEHLARCPRTARLLARVPCADVPGYAPTVFFSILDGRSRIPPHTGVTNTRLIVHLPLIVPAGCGFRVGSETREWRMGQGWVFDDTIEHEAWNDSDVPRAILIWDIWNPHLDAAERDLVRAAVHGIRDYYRTEAAPVGSGGGPTHATKA
jgi:aspartate beta-hydroxylase